MAQRTIGTLLCIAALRQPKKEQAIPASAGGLAGDRAQGSVAARLVLESVRQHLDHDLAITEAAREQCTRRRQPAVLRWPRSIYHPGAGIWPGEKLLRRADAKISIVGDLGGSAARPLAQISFSVSLQARGDAAKQKLFVRGFRCCGDQPGVWLLKVGDLPGLQSFERCNDGRVHGW